MSAILKLLIGASLVFALHYGVMRLAATAVPTQPIKVEVDPAALQRSFEISRAAQPNPQARAVIEDAERRIDEMNRSVPPKLSMPHR